MSVFAPADFTTNWSHDPFILSASSFYAEAYNAWAAFAGGSQRWLGTNSSSEWLKADCGDGFTGILTSYSITCPASGFTSRAPKTWTMQGSLDNSSWTTIDTVASETGWSLGQTRTYTVDTQTTAYRYFKMVITVNNGGNPYTEVSSMVLTGTVVTAMPASIVPNMTGNSSPSPFVVSASSVFTSPAEYYGFSTGTAAWIGTTNGVDWLEIDTGGAYVLSSYGFFALGAGPVTRAPKNWKLQGSNDNSAWVDLDTQTNQSSWGMTEARYYHLSTATAYRYFRILISANNGAATYTEINLLRLYGAAGSLAGPVQPIMMVIC